MQPDVSSSQKSAMSSSGSMAPLQVTPALAQITMGVNPAVRSSATARASAPRSRRKPPSMATVRMHSGLTPMILAARTCELWLSSLMYTVGRAGLPAFSLAATRASRAAARENPPGTFRITNPAPEPVDHHKFELAWTTGSQPGADVEVISGGDEVSQDPWPGGRGGNEREEAGMIMTRRIRKHFPGNPLDHVCGRTAFLGWLFQKQSLERSPEISIPGVFFRQAPDTIHQQFRGLPCGIEHESRLHFEFTAHVMVRDDVRLPVSSCNVIHQISFPPVNVKATTMLRNTLLIRTGNETGRRTNIVTWHGSTRVCCQRPGGGKLLLF